MPKAIKRDYEKLSQVWFFCEGCNGRHCVNVRATDGSHVWGWNGDLENPTFEPSVLVTWRTPKGYSNENPAPKGYDGEYEEHRCHSFVRNGNIQYLNDCTHPLAGKTIPLQPIE